MNKRFVLISDSPDKAQQDRITVWLQANHFGFWHHFPSAWLIVAPIPTSAHPDTAEWSSAKLRDALVPLAPALHFIVLEVQGSLDWAGFTEASRADWFHLHWNET